MSNPDSETIRRRSDGWRPRRARQWLEPVKASLPSQIRRALSLDERGSEISKAWQPSLIALRLPAVGCYLPDNILERKRSKMTNRLSLEKSTGYRTANFGMTSVMALLPAEQL